MNIVDILIIFIILLSAYLGFRNGFFKQSVILIGTILCFVIAFLFKDPIANFLSFNLPFFKFYGNIRGLTSLNIVMYQLISFSLLLIFFIAVLVVLVKITGIFEKILKFTIVLGIPSKVLGFIIGLIQGYVLTFILLFFLRQPVFNLNSIENSKYTPYILESSPGLSNLVKSTNNSVNEIYSIIKDYEDIPKTNDKIIEVLLKYKVIDDNYLLSLKERGKIDYIKEE